MLRFAPWKLASVLAMVAVAMLLVVPSFLPADLVDTLAARVPSFVPLRQIVLGLDLQGGAYMLMQVDDASVVKAQVEALRDDVRQKMRDGKIALSGGIVTQGRGVLVRIGDQAERDKAYSLLQALSQPIGGALAGGNGRTLDVTETDSGVQLTLTDAAIADKVRHAVTQSIEVLNRRVNAMGTKETVIAQQGLNRVLIEIPGLQDTTKLKEIIGQTAKLDFQLVADPGDPANEVETLPMQKGGGTITVQKRIMVDGGDLVDAQQSFDQQTGEPDVTFRFNLRGGQKFGQVTTENVGRPFAIVLDGKVISAPVIRSPITGGTGQITGNFTSEEASSLAILLRAGALPAKLTVVEERTVGPGLGQDSIDAGKRAAYVGAVLVVIYMIATYGVFGVFADLALAVHILFIFASMTLLGATLTLPGIAGIVFTIGMAVDSNVLIYERIREEAHLGRSVISALDAGFKRAFATIVDSNVTMFVAALILYLFGSGAVRGFAVSLGLGIITSIVTAVTMTRMMIALWYRRVRPTKIPI
ncbi:preprotein translocase subunit SecD [Roseiarcus fermentans]|uniref:Protein translocase subunit SecD n=1 Tax=Roseiarcus fermentans TaxID=1473586 RepID=A0A366FGL1_9HYPH|nr:protein translocase subunit SecD [Roseiarcus fermentans]RBP13822.1 preprotein translocase subunit SecD [Roseiarcus fermentans]